MQTTNHRSGFKMPILKPALILFSAVIFPLLTVFTSIAAGQETGDKPQASQPPDLQQPFTRIAKTVRPAVVNVSVRAVQQLEPSERFRFFFGSPYGEEGPQQPRQRVVEGTGSGIIVRPEGLVLTNEHVVRNAREIVITLYDQREFTGKVIGRDPRTDLAVIRIDAKEQLPFVTLGDSDQVQVGEWVAAIGSPFGLQETVTSGIISAVRQQVPIQQTDYQEMLQTDAAINQGNSGGPLVNTRGEVIGINTAIFAPTGVFSGVGFAIPVNSVKEVLDELITEGKVVRGWMGAMIQPVTPAVAQQLKLPDAQGVLIRGVAPDSPAEKAKLRNGDVIRQFAGTEVNTAGELQSLVAKTKPGTKVPVTITRNGEVTGVEVTITEAPVEQPAPRGRRR